MKDEKMIRAKAFGAGLAIGLLLFISVNYFDYITKNMFVCDDCMLSFGFPFTLYQEGGFITIKEVLWFGLIADILIAIIFSFIVGLIFRFVWSKFQPNPLK